MIKIGCFSDKLCLVRTLGPAIHRSAWKGCSAKLDFRFTEFSEVRHTLATISNTKYTPFEGCDVTHKPGRVSACKSGQRL